MPDSATVITFFSSKGGVGKSVLALNSAMVFSSKMGKRTLLIDLDLQFGDISVLLDKHTEKTILEMIDDHQYGNYGEIQQYLYKYSDTLDVLFAPRNPESSEYLDKGMIVQIMDNVKEYYDLILIDAGVNFEDHTLYALDISEYILFITAMDILSLKNTKLGLSVMRSLSYTENKLKLVLNFFNTRYGINEADIKSAFPEKIFARISEDEKHMRKSVNLGIPLYEYKRNCHTMREIEKMCKDLIDQR